MAEMFWLFTPFLVMVGVLLTLMISAPIRLWLKGAMVGAGAFAIAAAYLAVVTLLSHPKPMDLELWHAGVENVTVLGVMVEREDWIHLWLQLPDVAGPRAYRMEWSEDLVKQLTEAQIGASENQSEVQLRMPFESSLDEDEPQFYATPQQAPPPKNMSTAPTQYQHPTRAHVPGE